MEIVAISLVVASLSLLLIVGYYYTFPDLPYGKWSAPLISKCAGTSQDATSHSIYECSPNPVTGFGCVVPNSKPQQVIYKNLVIVNQCNSDNLRDISFTWQAQTTKPTICISSGKNCCDANQNCYVETDYKCVQIAPTGGENRCTLSYLPGILPDSEKPFDPASHGGYITTAITTRTACLANLCTT